MEFKDIVKNRYSCKKFSDKQVEGEKLTAILEAGRLAPTTVRNSMSMCYRRNSCSPRLTRLRHAVMAPRPSWSLLMTRQRIHLSGWQEGFRCGGCDNCHDPYDSGGSGFGKAVESLKGSCPGATIVEGKLLNRMPN